MRCADGCGNKNVFPREGFAKRKIPIQSLCVVPRWRRRRACGRYRKFRRRRFEGGAKHCRLYQKRDLIVKLLCTCLFKSLLIVLLVAISLWCRFLKNTVPTTLTVFASLALQNNRQSAGASIVDVLCRQTACQQTIVAVIQANNSLRSLANNSRRHSTKSQRLTYKMVGDLPTKQFSAYKQATVGC